MFNKLLDLSNTQTGNGSGSTEYLNYCEDGSEAHYLVEVSAVKWLDEKRIWITDVLIHRSSNPASPPGVTRTFTLNMGTEQWTIDAFKRNLANFIFSAAGFDPDDPGEGAPTLTSEDTFAIAGPEQPLSGARLWMKVYRKKKQTGEWSPFSHYAFKPQSFEDWSPMAKTEAIS